MQNNVKTITNAKGYKNISLLILRNHTMVFESHLFNSVAVDNHTEDCYCREESPKQRHAIECYCIKQMSCELVSLIL